jgi:hypothetical protein
VIAVNKLPRAVSREVLAFFIQCVPLATEPGISLMSCQQQFLEKFGGRHPRSKSSIWALSKKLETKGTLLDDQAGGRPKMNAGFGSAWDTLYFNTCNQYYCVLFTPFLLLNSRNVYFSLFFPQCYLCYATVSVYNNIRKALRFETRNNSVHLSCLSCGHPDDDHV